uniref:Uncharacterized protein n=1 Tax=Catagonus wagneri TaxID=51154 RepID=A0A8C3WES4_9CETA
LNQGKACVSESHSQFDIKRWLLYTFCNWFDIIFQLQLCILRKLKCLYRSILYNLKDLKTSWTIFYKMLSFIIVSGKKSSIKIVLVSEFPSWLTG